MISPSSQPRVTVVVAAAADVVAVLLYLALQFLLLFWP
jgi:hypothetical protein